MTTINYRFQVAGHNAADWTTGNPVLLDREWAVERDTGKIKLGDGSTAWNSLSYFLDPSTFGSSAAWGSIAGTLSAQTDLASALGAKEPSIAAGTTGQYWRGDKSWQTLDKTAVGLGSVDNTADASKAVLSATKLATARTIGMTGDVTWSSGSFDGSGDVTAAATLASSGVSAGSYTNANITVDAKGRVTAASHGSAAGAASRLSSTTTSVGTSTLTTEQDLQTYSMPGGTLASDGQLVRITASGTFAATTRSRNVRLYFGSTVIGSWIGLTSASDVAWHMELLVLRTGAATQRSSGFAFRSTSSGMALTTPAETLASAITIKVTGQVAGTPVANDVTCNNLVVELLP